MQGIKKRILALNDRREAFELLKVFESLYATQSLSSAGLAIKAGGTTPQFLSTAFNYMLNGQLYAKAAVAATTLSTAVTWAAVASTFNAGAVLLAIDATGTVTQFSTNITSTTTSAAAALQGIVWPMIPDTYTVFGMILVNNSAANTAFTGGTTNLDAANITVTYINFVGPFYPAQA